MFSLKVSDVVGLTVHRLMALKTQHFLADHMFAGEGSQFFWVKGSQSLILSAAYGSHILGPQGRPFSASSLMFSGHQIQRSLISIFIAVRGFQDLLVCWFQVHSFFDYSFF